IDRVREIVEMTKPRDAVFHRAFDFVADWRKEMEALISVGCKRIWTSGGQPTAALGAARLREMMDFAADRIEIMPGGGIRANNIVEIVQKNTCHQIRTGGTTKIDGGSLSASPNVEFCNSSFNSGASHRA